MNRQLLIAAAALTLLGLALNGCAPKDNAKIEDAPPPVTVQAGVKPGTPEVGASAGPTGVSAAPGADSPVGAPLPSPAAAPPK